jgi:GNAT superfamily N-acetyltransferase
VRLATQLASLRDAVRRLGARDGLLFAVATVLARVSGGRVRLYRYVFVAQPVAAPLANLRKTTEAVRPINAGDALVAQFPRPAHVIAERFRMGAHCFGAERAGRFAGFLWLKESRYPEDEVRCLYVLEPTDGAVWDFDVHVEPDFRLGRTFVRLWDHANAWMRERGYRWTISRISAFNRESLAAHARFGIRPVGSATFVRLGALQVALLDRAPFLHASWRDDQAPTLRLRPPRSNGDG